MFKAAFSFEKSSKSEKMTEYLVIFQHLQIPCDLSFYEFLLICFNSAIHKWSESVFKGQLKKNKSAIRIQREWLNIHSFINIYKSLVILHFMNFYWIILTFLLIKDLKPSCKDQLGKNKLASVIQRKWLNFYIQKQSPRGVL